MRMLGKTTCAAGALATVALFTPGLPARGSAYFPTIFGPFSGDCTTPNSSSAVVTCTKSNGTSFASMAFQAASNVAITGGSIAGTAISGAAGSFTTLAASGAATLAAATFSGLASGVANTFTGLSTQTGGHVVGTADLTATATLTAAQEDVCVNATSAATITLSGTNGLHQVVSDCTGTASSAPVTVAAPSGSKLLTPSGLVQSITYANNYQSANFVCHSNNNVCVVE